MRKNKKKFKVLSLFDGMSCAQMAVRRIFGENYEYLASELDPLAVKVSSDNFPGMVHLGDVKGVKKIEGVHLLVGGSPCQGFSIAGKKKRMEDERSRLFWEFVRVLRLCRPKYFILENVSMDEASIEVFSRELGVRPVRVNSSLFTAQSRERLFWTNIPFELPESKKLVVRDVLDREHGMPLLSPEILKDVRLQEVKERLERPKRVGVIGKGGQGYRIYSDLGKSITIAASSGGIGRNCGLYLTREGVRRLSVNECKKLHGIPTEYKMDVSPSAAYKMLGNAFTVDVIEHILRSALTK